MATLFRISLFSLALGWGIIGHAQSTGGLPSVDEIGEYIGAYLGDDQLGEQVKQALDAYTATLGCKVEGHDPTVSFQAFYDALIKVGQILCNLRITCAVNYLKYLIPVPIGLDVLTEKMTNAEKGVILGRWYQIKGPITAGYAAWLKQLMTTGNEDSMTKLFLVYPGRFAPKEEVVAQTDQGTTTYEVKRDEQYVNEMLSEEGVLEVLSALLRVQSVPDLYKNVFIKAVSGKDSNDQPSEKKMIKFPIPIGISDPPANKDDQNSNKIAAVYQQDPYPGYIPGFVILKGKTQGRDEKRGLVIVLGDTTTDRPGTINCNLNAQNEAQSLNLQSNLQGTKNSVYLYLVGDVSYWVEGFGENVVIPVLEMVSQFMEQMNQVEQDARTGKSLLPENQNQNQGGSP